MSDLQEVPSYEKDIENFKTVEEASDIFFKKFSRNKYTPEFIEKIGELDDISSKGEEITEDELRNIFGEKLTTEEMDLVIKRYQRS